MVNDHLLEYFDFEGIIPEGQYGFVTVVIRNSVTYRLLEENDYMKALESGKIVMELHGNTLKGGFILMLFTLRLVQDSGIKLFDR